MLALIKNNQYIKLVKEGTNFNHDDFYVSPAIVGWEHKDYTLKTVVEADPVPAGKMIVSTTVEMIEGEPTFVNQYSDLPPQSVEAQKYALASYTADKRYNVEVGGTIWNNYPVHTDRESQNKIIAERIAIDYEVREDPDGWKFADGVFRLVSDADFILMANAVRQHVRNCFAVEAAVLADIEDGTITSTAEIDAAFTALTQS